MHSESGGSGHGERADSGPEPLGRGSLGSSKDTGQSLSPLCCSGVLFLWPDCVASPGQTRLKGPKASTGAEVHIGGLVGGF